MAENKGVYIGLSPFPLIVANESLEESPTKHETILVVTITGKGDDPRYITRVISPQ